MWRFAFVGVAFGARLTVPTSVASPANGKIFEKEKGLIRQNLKLF